MYKQNIHIQKAIEATIFCETTPKVAEQIKQTLIEFTMDLPKISSMSMFLYWQ